MGFLQTTKNRNVSTDWEKAITTEEIGKKRSKDVYDIAISDIIMKHVG